MKTWTHLFRGSQGQPDHRFVLEDRFLKPPSPAAVCILRAVRSLMLLPSGYRSLPLTYTCPGIQNLFLGLYLLDRGKKCKPWWVRQKFLCTAGHGLFSSKIFLRIVLAPFPGAVAVLLPQCRYLQRPPPFLLLLIRIPTDITD